MSSTPPSWPATAITEAVKWTVAALGAGLLVLVRARRKACLQREHERRKRHALLEATADLTRRNADALRWLLYVAGPGKGALTARQLEAAASEHRAELRIGTARIWLASGQAERRDIRTTQEQLAVQPAAPEDEQS